MEVILKEKFPRIEEVKKNLNYLNEKNKDNFKSLYEEHKKTY